MSEQQKMDAGVLGGHETEYREIIQEQQEAGVDDITQGTDHGELEERAAGFQLPGDEVAKRLQAYGLHRPGCHYVRVVDRSAVVH